ncbi:hypothetical protein CAMSH0001_0467 [Campylobacter showae RM3277]|uniref:Uncharacterized protein n=1 Tax=Campylobacter showae RM3277 TaxID=553219 RepID=C6RFG2_9BACT|nr:hypothetical protein CAMSH0001_0467 [Campylobacter showae RM3277]
MLFSKLANLAQITNTLSQILIRIVVESSNLAVKSRKCK